MRPTLHLIIAHFAIAAALGAEGTATVTVAGRKATSTPPPLEINGELMLPVCFLTDRLGLHVERASGDGAWRISGYQHYLKIRRDSPRCVLDVTPLEANQTPRIINGHLYVPADMLWRAFGISVSNGRARGDFTLTPAGATVRDVRGGPYGTHTRLAIDITGPAAYWLSVSPGQLTLDIAPPKPGCNSRGEMRLFRFDEALGVTVKTRIEADGWTRLTIEHNASGKPKVFTLGDPCRIVVDLPSLQAPAKPAQVVEEEAGIAEPPNHLPPALATPWQVTTFITARGPVRVFVLQCSPTALRPALAASTIKQRAPVSLIASRARAPAAVNGGYFDWSGPPLGMLVIDGEWIKHPILNRCVLGITRDGQARMARLKFDGAVRIENVGRFELSGLNTGHSTPDSVILYTRRWGSELAGSPTKTRVVIGARGTVTHVETHGAAVPIPEQGYVLSAGSAAGRRLAQAKRGARVWVHLDTAPRWPKLRHAIGAGPQLVKDGAIAVTADEEEFRPDVRRIAPRPAIGIGRDGNLWIAVVDSGPAVGVSLAEAALLMHRLGCRDAMALDGGGSTTVVAGGRVLNRCTDGDERPVSNALLVFCERASPGPRAASRSAPRVAIPPPTAGPPTPLVR